MEQAVSAKRVNQEAVSFGSSRWTRIRRELKKNRLLAIGLILVIALVATVLAAPLLTSWNPNDVDLSKRLLLPGQEGHLLGTDGFGRDLFARILYGGQNSLALAVLIVLTNAVIGMIIGAFSAYSGGLIDAAIMRLVDLLMSFPSRIMTIFIVGVFGPSLKNLFLSLILMGWIGYARMSRSLVLSLKERIFVQSSRGIGCSGARLLFRHIIPHVLPTLFIYATMHIGSAVLSIAALGFLGLGVQPPTAEWGTMLSDAKQYVFLYPHMVLLPGAAIVLSVFAFNLLGDGLRDLADPHAKEIIKT